IPISTPDLPLPSQREPNSMMRQLFGAGCLLLAATSACGHPRVSDTPQAVQTGVLITNATVIDGTGSPGRRVSVRVQGERIAAVGDLQPTSADRVVDAGGLVLAPC